jgi:hypothetical protein
MVLVSSFRSLLSRLPAVFPGLHLCCGLHEAGSTVASWLPEETCTTLAACGSSGTFEEALPVPLLTRTWYWWPLAGTLTVAFPVEHLTVTDRGAAAKEMSALPWLVVTCTAEERSAVAVTLPEPVVICSGPDTPLTFTPPWLPLTVTGDDRPETVMVFDPELTVTAVPGGTATWNLEPQLNTSPEQSMPS